MWGNSHIGKTKILVYAMHAILPCSLHVVFPQQNGLRQPEGGLLANLPEEDQDESEVLTLPPNKDPAGQTITNPLVNNKRQANSKQMVCLTNNYNA